MRRLFSTNAPAATAFPAVEVHGTAEEQTKTRTITQAEKDTYLRDALGIKKVIRNGRAEWVRNKSIKESKLQFGAINGDPARFEAFVQSVSAVAFPWSAAF